MRRILLLILASLLLISCEKDLNVAFPFEGERFVIFSKISNDLPIRVGIDKTYPPTGESIFNNDFLDSTKVELLRDGNVIEELIRRPSKGNFYVSAQDYRPQLGGIYQLRVSSTSNIPTAISRPELLLPSVNIDSVWVEKQEINSPLNSSSKAKVLKIRLIGFDDLTPYFLFEITPFGQNRVLSANVMSSESLDELENPCMYLWSSSRIFHKASCYDPSATIFTFYVETDGAFRSELTGIVESLELDELSIKVSTVNKSYFDYYKNTTIPLDFFSVFEGVTRTYSNFENGYGASLTKNTSTVRLLVD